MSNNNYCVIMAGGIGSRFWPMSTKSCPKQFIDILGTGKTFIRQTYERFASLVPVENFLILTNQDYKDMVLTELPELCESQVLCEPCMRNTAPCILYAAMRIAALNSEANMIITPSDHFVTGEREFINVVSQSLSFITNSDKLMTIGINPTRPETGYGYIQAGDNIEGGIFKVKKFTEKPSLEVARNFVASGEFMWNAGIFIWSTRAIISAFKTYQSELYSIFQAGLKVFNTHKEQEFINTNYPLCNSISIDYGIMEHSKDVYVHSSSFGWSDVGTWGSLFENSAKDISTSNSVVGKQVRCYDVTGSVVRVEGDKVAIIEGLKDYIVVDNSKALLICSKENEQKIKNFIEDINYE